jgi:hypothetical protein
MIVVLPMIVLFFVLPFYFHYKDRCKNCGGKLTENSDDPCVCKNAEILTEILKNDDENKTN